MKSSETKKGSTKIGAAFFIYQSDTVSLFLIPHATGRGVGVAAQMAHHYYASSFP